MKDFLWRLWLRLSGQKYPRIGGTLRNPRGAVYTYRPQEMYAAWNKDGKFIDFGKWPPLMGSA